MHAPPCSPASAPAVEAISHLARCCPTTAYPPPHLSQHRLLVAQPYDEDAVGLTDTAHGPRCQGTVGLVQDDAVDVLLLCQPAREAVLLDAAEMEGSASGPVVCR